MTTPSKREGYIHSAVGSILRIAAEARKNPYTPEAAQDCFGRIEEAARELYEALRLGGPAAASNETTGHNQGNQEAQHEAVTGDHTSSTHTQLDPERRRVTIVRSQIDRARRYLRDGKVDDALKALNMALRSTPVPKS